jgi:uncharacterized membrane protein YhaH (DUF805 family)
MNNLLQNYMGFDGRLNRQPFWISSIILAVVAAIVQFIILQILGGGGVIDVQAMIAGGKSAQDVVNALTAVASKAGWAQLVTLIIFAYPIAAVAVKRRHDRGSSGIDIWIYLALGAVLAIIQGLGLGMTTMDIGGVTVPSPSMLLTVIGAVAGIFAIYLLVVLGFLRGTPGANQYGPDPLQG